MALFKNGIMQKVFSLPGKGLINEFMAPAMAPFLCSLKKFSPLLLLAGFELIVPPLEKKPPGTYMLATSILASPTTVGNKIA